MKVGMKNAIELLGDLHEYFDFAINEECHQWNECGVSVSLDASLPTKARVIMAVSEVFS